MIETFAPLSVKGSLKTIPLAKVKIDQSRNVRQADKYTKESLQTLIDSMLAQGFMPSEPVKVSELSDGSYRMMQGHRRGTAAGLAGLTEIPAMVFKNLSEADELRIMIDHGQLGLDEVEKKNAVQRLMTAGLNRFQIAAQLNENGTWVQRMMELSKLPTYIQNQWVLNKTDSKKAEIKVTLNVIRGLYQKALEDRKSGNITDEVGEVGPAFLEELKGVVAEGKSSTDAQKAKAYTASQLETIAQTQRQPIVKELFKGLCGKGGNVNDALNAINAALEALYGAPAESEMPILSERS